jgi:hypothetical protein
MPATQFIFPAVSAEPPIPFGYRSVTTAQKGDGIWDGTRFRKARKCWPSTEATAVCIIRKCEVVQEALPITGVPQVVSATVTGPGETITVTFPEASGTVECDWL